MEGTREVRGGWRVLAPIQDDGQLMLMPRDLSMMRVLAENRFMDANQLATLFGEKARRRLLRLAGHGYVMRPKAQRVWRQVEGGGSKPCVYALGNRGARALVNAGIGVDARARDWNESNTRLAEFARTIPHQLAIAEVRIAFQRAADDRGLRLVGGSELAGREVHGLPVPGRDGLLVPDWICALADIDGEPRLFFVEVDRDTEDTAETKRNGRYGRMQQSLERKYSGYLAYARSWRQDRQFGVHSFRVLTITTGGDRKLTNVAKVAGKVCEGSGHRRFMVTSFDRLRGADLFDVSWLDGRGEETRLLL